MAVTALTGFAALLPNFAATAATPPPDLAGTHLSGVARVTTADCNAEGQSTLDFTASGTVVTGAYAGGTFVEDGTITIGPLNVGTTGPNNEFATGLVESVDAAFTITMPDGTRVVGAKTMDADAYPVTPTGTCNHFEAYDSPTWPYNSGEYHRADSGVHYEATITTASGTVSRQSGDSRLSFAYTQLCAANGANCQSGGGPFGQSFITTDAVADRDGDGVSDDLDNCPDTPNPDQSDRDSDGAGDVCDTTPNGDADDDDIDDESDNCPNTPNTDQVDTDGDDAGDACDLTPNGDTDRDGVDNETDNCPVDPNSDQSDLDQDGLGDACDSTPNGDIDMDTVDNESDNCVSIPNTDQTDSDGDGAGDVCDTTPNGDVDVDTIDDETDNCVTTPNADQTDTDGDGIGDACDTTPGGENPPPTKDACKKGGWQAYTDDRGVAFKNQGDCVSFVATDGKNQAN